MSKWERMMVFYGSHHRSKVNVIVHIIGVPIIVTGVVIPLALVKIGVPGLSVTLAWLAALALVEFYFSLDRGFALGSVLLFGAVLVVAHGVAERSTSQALAIAAACFVGGYALQFVAHGVEGKKPALFDNLLLAQITAPLFIVAEVYKLLGLRRDLFARVDAEIERLESSNGAVPAA